MHTTDVYALALHDALPILDAPCSSPGRTAGRARATRRRLRPVRCPRRSSRSEEYTSELQSLRHLVCRLLLEKKNERSDAPPPEKHETSARGRHHGPLAQAN